MTRSRLIVVAVVAGIALGVGAYLAYDNVLRGDAAAPLALPSAGTATDAAAGTADPATSVASATAGNGASTAPGTGTGRDVTGTWTIVEGSEAGYRVREQLANLPAESDAIGRTSNVSGSITLVAAGDAARLTEGEITVDTTTIASDRPQRDNRLRSEGLQTGQFPTATFKITAPVDIPAAALAGTASDVNLAGDLTLHGVTKSVQIPAKARLVDGRIQVVGSLPITLADYQITAPNVGGFIVSIADDGTLEFLAVFARA